MKNIVSIIALAFIMVLGVQNASAQELSQDADRPEVIAKKKTQDLTKTLVLNGDQERAVFRALVSNEINYKKNIDGKDASSPEVIASKKKFDESMDATMKKTLDATQYAKWKAMNK